MKTIENQIDEIFSLILEAIKEAATKPKKYQKKTVATAKILIAEEHMFSVMVDKGSLNDSDVKLLKAVREKMKNFQIEGVKLSEVKHTEYHTYTDSDSSSYGPCISYYIQAKKVVAE